MSKKLPDNASLDESQELMFSTQGNEQKEEDNFFSVDVIQ